MSLTKLEQHHLRHQRRSLHSTTSSTCSSVKYKRRWHTELKFKNTELKFKNTELKFKPNKCELN